MIKNLHFFGNTFVNEKVTIVEKIKDLYFMFDLNIFLYNQYSKSNESILRKFYEIIRLNDNTIQDDIFIFDFEPEFKIEIYDDLYKKNLFIKYNFNHSNYEIKYNDLYCEKTKNDKKIFEEFLDCTFVYENELRKQKYLILSFFSYLKESNHNFIVYNLPNLVDDNWKEMLELENNLLKNIINI